jgi:transposase-like protein
MSKRQVRTYTDEDKERARVAWEENGRSLRATERATGISVATLSGWQTVWLNPPEPPVAPPEVFEAVFEQARTNQKLAVIEAAWAAARAGFARAIEALPDATAQQAATVAGIAVDKAQLLSGAATERHEHDIRAILATLPGGVRQTIVSLAGDEIREANDAQDSR